MSGRTKLLLFFFVIVVPGLLAAVTARVSFTRAETVEFCSSCHVMTPWVKNVTGKESDSLAAEHYQHRWIQHDQCYTCHSNYGFLGPLQAKIKGVRHVVAFYIGTRGHIDLYDAFPNENCLQCHAEAKGFLENENHEPISDILTGKDRCVECHEGVHGVDQDEGNEADAAADAGKKDGDAKPSGAADDGHDKGGADDAE